MSSIAPPPAAGSTRHPRLPYQGDKPPAWDINPNQHETPLGEHRPRRAVAIRGAINPMESFERTRYGVSESPP
ncbi:MAG TPA: hypothetical protein VKA27_04495 [Sunxiuqinia sp.]|nr:hypothetical protein [Sunxiuqinia sp.]